MLHKKFQKVISFILITVLIFSLAACGKKAGQDSVKEIKERGKLIVGTEAQYPPYEFKDMDAKFVGADIWLAEQIAEALDVELEIVDMSFAGIVPAVQGKQVDLGIAAFTKDEERAKVIDFSDLYEKSEQLLVVKAGEENNLNSKEALAGKKVGAQKGSIQSALIKKALPDSELFELEKYPALALEVENNNIAGFVLDKAVGDSLIASSNGQLGVADFTFTDEEASVGKAVVAAKGNTDLLEVVNQVISKVTEDGSYQKAFDEAVELADAIGE